MNQNSPFQHQPKKKTARYRTPANFIEALKSTGGSMVKDTAKGLAQDVVGGVAKQVTETVFNASDSNTNQPNNQPENFNFQDYLQSSETREKLTRQHQQVKYEYETSTVEIFNQRQLENQKQIDAIKLELEKLAREVINLDQSTQTAIQQEVVKPGTYHLNFFQSLLQIVRVLRKQVVEARHWAQMHSQRNHSKSYYWQQSNKKAGGTKFMLSGERSVVTQTG